MARATANKLYRTFTKGLITEAGYLTYPENASIDELNTVIKVKGSRSRRLGIDYEPSSSPISVTSFSQTALVSEYGWRNVGEDSSVNFLVVQVSNRLNFFDMDASPITKKTFELNLTDYKASTATSTDIQVNPAQFASGKGLLFVAHPYMNPIRVEYDANTDTVTAVPILITIRDFDGVFDDLGNEEQPTTLSKEHLYNLKNQGWIVPYSAAVTSAPGANDTNFGGWTSDHEGLPRNWQAHS